MYSLSTMVVMRQLENAPTPGPMPRGAKIGMGMGALVAAPGVGLLVGRLMDSAHPLSKTEQMFYTADICLGALIIFTAFMVGTYRR